jgi:hypothetical protein
MVRVISVHHFSRQDVSRIPPPVASATSNSHVIIATENQQLEVKQRCQMIAKEKLLFTALLVPALCHGWSTRTNETEEKMEKLCTLFLVFHGVLRSVGGPPQAKSSPKKISGMKIIQLIAIDELLLLLPGP